ncbi:MAG: ABC transporter permease [Treponema sp.]
MFFNANRLKRIGTFAALSFFGASFASAVLFFFVPVCAAFVPLFGGRFAAENALSAAEIRHIFNIFAFTAGQAAFSAALACLIGTAAAFFCANRRFFGRRMLMSLAGIPLCVPAIITALSYILFFGNNGTLNTLLKSVLHTEKVPFRFLYSIKAVIVCHAFYNFPIAMHTVAKAWAQINADEEDAALIVGASRPRIFRAITLPYLLPPIAVSFLLIFLFCFFSFVIILLFGTLGTATLETELYRAARFRFDAASASRFAAVSTGTAAAVIAAHAKIRAQFAAHRSPLQTFRRRTRITGLFERAAFFVLRTAIALFLLLPLLSILVSSVYNAHYAFGLNRRFSAAAWTRVFSSRLFFTSLLQSLRTGAAASLLAVSAALFFAYIDFQKLRFPFKNALPFLPLAVSSVVLGFGWNVAPHLKSPAILVLAEASLFWPFAWTQIQNYLSRIPENLTEAALLVSDSKASVFFRIVLPLCKKGIAEAAAFTFAMSIGDATLPLVLNLSGFSNLSLLLFGYSSSYRFAESAVIAAVLIALSGFAFFFQEGADRRGTQFLPKTVSKC